MEYGESLMKEALYLAKKSRLNTEEKKRWNALMVEMHPNEFDEEI